VTTVVLLLAFSGLLWSTLRDGTEYYKNVDEVLADPAAWKDTQLQLHGYVVPGSIMRKADSLEWRFKVRNTPARSGPEHSGDDEMVITATYHGVVPDTFQDEAEVVLKGRLEGTTFHTAPNGVMAKCPSKYEEAQAALAAPGS
jgi:cytochrome c-type biogenesis protein CcmE